MRIEFKQEGGLAYFPGLARPVVVDGEQLAAADAAVLQRRVEAAQFFEQPAEGAAPKAAASARTRAGAADLQRYTITVEDGGRRHTVTLTDPVDDPALEDLLGYLRAKSREQRAALRASAKRPAGDKAPDASTDGPAGGAAPAR
jgi:hypothetical protein